MATAIIGKEINRYEGRAKVTGRANYAADNHVDGLVHAVGVVSTVAAGKIESIDAAEATRLPGVLGVWSHANFPRVYRSSNDMAAGTRVGEVRPPFEDDVVYYAGQFVAVVVAETFEQARAAARRVRVVYQAEANPPVELGHAAKACGEQPPSDEESAETKRGDAEKSYEEAAVTVDVTYTTPVEVHNPLELHAAVARWKDGSLEIDDSTQWVVGQRKALAAMLGVPPEAVTVRSPFVGGGFGGKLFLWPHSVIAAALARELGRPVKMVLERRHAFTTAGHRPATRQRLRIGAARDGTLLSLRHDTLAHTSLVHEFLESSGSTTSLLYRCPNVAVTHRLVRANVGTPTPMRAPGAASGMIALEAAMDELAVALELDPLELRRRNFAEEDESEGRPWSSNHLKECYRVAAERFGWSRRRAKPGAMRDGDEILGWGMATASWTAERDEATVRVQLHADGTVRVSCATQDIGTGTYTVFAQVAAEVLGLPVERITVVLGDSSLPEGPISGGSCVTSTVVPAIAQAARKATEALVKIAVGKDGPLAGEDAEAVKYSDGAVTGKAGKRATIAEVLAAANVERVAGEGKSAAGGEAERYSFRCFGAHFVEVRWDPGIARLRVSRVVSAFDVGRVINRKTAANQIYGSLIMGLGMTLLEKSVYDPRDGRVVTDNLADYLVPVHADTPEMDVVFLDRPDPHAGEFGARGIGEIGITGIGGAILNAIHHATGKRLRDLPVTVEQLLGVTG